MRIFWHGTSDIRLWILLNVNLLVKLWVGPVVMNEAGECGVLMRVLRHWTSDIWLRIFLADQLNSTDFS